MTEQQVGRILDAVNDYLRRALQAFAQKQDKANDDRIDSLRQYIEAIPAGAPGKDGRDGERGERGEKGEKGEAGEKGEIGPEGQRGADGAKGEAGANGERGERGIPGPAGDQGLMGPQGEKGVQGEKGLDGKSVDMVELRAMIVEIMEPLIAKAIAAIPIPKDGEPGRDGRDGKQGPPGRDATQIEYLSSIDPERSYPRGTHARHAGGILRAVRTTDPFVNGSYEEAGWEAAVMGFRGAEFFVSEDGRDWQLELYPTAGKAIGAKVSIPVPRYRGVWKDGEYARGDMVTWGGSVWHANAVTSAKPGTSADWTMAVKRGSDGKDGASGRDGRDGKDVKAPNQQSWTPPQ